MATVLTHGNDPKVWEQESFDFAVAALTKSKLAKFAGQTADATKFESEYNGYMNKLAHMDERAAKELERRVVATADAKYQECRAKLLVAQHSNDSVDALSHGTKWKDHKYIRIENGRYIYPDDLKGRRQNGMKDMLKTATQMDEPLEIAARKDAERNRTNKVQKPGTFPMTETKKLLDATRKIGREESKVSDRSDALLENGNRLNISNNRTINEKNYNELLDKMEKHAELRAKKVAKDNQYSADFDQAQKDTTQSFIDYVTRKGNSMFSGKLYEFFDKYDERLGDKGNGVEAALILNAYSDYITEINKWSKDKRSTLDLSRRNELESEIEKMLGVKHSKSTFYPFLAHALNTKVSF